MAVSVSHGFRGFFFFFFLCITGFYVLKKKTLQKASYCLTCGLLTINDNGLHDSDGAEIQKLYKSKTNESPARTDRSIRCLLQFNGLDCKKIKEIQRTESEWWWWCLWVGGGSGGRGRRTA